MTDQIHDAISGRMSDEKYSKWIMERYEKHRSITVPNDDTKRVLPSGTWGTSIIVGVQAAAHVLKPPIHMLTF